eukprot:scaffold23625_cov137-Cylindrotheca_fusiformis.AAC.6
MTKIRKSQADKIVAATAGVDNWKTWAGRTHGTDEFEVLDVFRGMKRSIRNRFLTSTPPPGSLCPVCFGEAEVWYLTSCAHAVCMSCFQAYAASQVRDKEQSGPLKCPICPRVLRKSDAIAALANDKELVQLWDRKIRNQLLRALPAYRSCPRCSNDSTEATGGGFVTPSCLSPQYKERRDKALSRMKQGAILSIGAVSVVVVGMIRYIATNPSKSPVVDLFFMFAPIYVFFGRTSGIFLVMEQKAASWARDALFKPISVECPCCSFEFILPASATTVQDAETKSWMEQNTRPCPSCSVPITKNGGCNHIHCSHCNAKFCWACMRLRTSCRAYQCQNGGVNASPVPDALAQGLQDSILGRIDRVLDREAPRLRPRDGIVLLLALFFRDRPVVQLVVERSMSIVSTVCSIGFLTTFALIFTLKAMITSLTQRGYQRDERPVRYHNADWSEEAMVAEAIRRSLREQ